MLRSVMRCPTGVMISYSLNVKQNTISVLSASKMSTHNNKRKMPKNCPFDLLMRSPPSSPSPSPAPKKRSRISADLHYIPYSRNLQPRLLLVLGVPNQAFNWVRRVFGIGPYFDHIIPYHSAEYCLNFFAILPVDGAAISSSIVKKLMTTTGNGVQQVEEGMFPGEMKTYQHQDRQCQCHMTLQATHRDRRLLQVHLSKVGCFRGQACIQIQASDRDSTVIIIF